MPLPGWYPDPTGDYEVRYWDGAQWSDAVANQGVQFEEPVDWSVLPEQESMVWVHDPHQLSTHRVWVDDGARRGVVREFPLWAVSEVRVTESVTHRSQGLGRVAVVIGYEGYVGRTHWVMSGVPQPHEVAALVRKWANRNRRLYEQA